VASVLSSDARFSVLGSGSLNFYGRIRIFFCARVWGFRLWFVSILVEKKIAEDSPTRVYFLDYFKKNYGFAIIFFKVVCCSSALGVNTSKYLWLSNYLMVFLFDPHSTVLICCCGAESSVGPEKYLVRVGFSGYPDSTAARLSAPAVRRSLVYFPLNYFMVFF
jgi:hypothetical protein